MVGSSLGRPREDEDELLYLPDVAVELSRVAWFTSKVYHVVSSCRERLCM